MRKFSVMIAQGIPVIGVQVKCCVVNPGADVLCPQRFKNEVTALGKVVEVQQQGVQVQRMTRTGTFFPGQEEYRQILKGFIVAPPDLQAALVVAFDAAELMEA